MADPRDLQDYQKYVQNKLSKPTGAGKPTQQS